MSAESDPICGACRNPRSLHHEERHGITDYVFCNLETTGDVFTDEPGHSDLMGLLEEERPDVYEQLVHLWRVRNGHEPEPSPELLPCPFCGSDCFIAGTDDFGDVIANCSGCNALMACASDEEARASWNRRTP